MTVYESSGRILEAHGDEEEDREEADREFDDLLTRLIPILLLIWTSRGSDG